MTGSAGRVIEWLMIFCAVYFIVDWMVNRWGGG